MRPARGAETAFFNMPEMLWPKIEQSACQKLAAAPRCDSENAAAPVDARGTVRGRGDREGSGIIVCEARLAVKH
jgi:hypothetical protein